MVRQVAAEVSSEAGDGTTTAVVLTRRIAAEAVKAMSAGVDPESACAKASTWPSAP